MSTKEETQVKKDLSTLGEKTKKAIFPTLTLASVGAHFITLQYVQSSFKLLDEGGLTDIALNPIIDSLSGRNSLSVYLLSFLALFLFLMAVYVTTVQFIQMRKYQVKGD